MTALTTAAKRKGELFLPSKGWHAGCYFTAQRLNGRKREENMSNLWIWELGFDWDVEEGDGDNRTLYQGLVDSKKHRGNLHNPSDWNCPASPMWFQRGDEMKFNLYNVTRGDWTKDEMDKYTLRKLHIHFKHSLGGTPKSPISELVLNLNPVPAALQKAEKTYLNTHFSVVGNKAHPLWQIAVNGATNFAIIDAAHGHRFIVTASIIVEKDGKLRSFYSDPEMAVGGMNL